MPVKKRKRSRKGRKSKAAGVVSWVKGQTRKRKAKKARRKQRSDLRRRKRSNRAILKDQDLRTNKEIEDALYDGGHWPPRYILRRYSQKKSSPRAYSYKTPQGLSDFIGR